MSKKVFHGLLAAWLLSMWTGKSTSAHDFSVADDLKGVLTESWNTSSVLDNALLLDDFGGSGDASELVEMPDYQDIKKHFIKEYPQYKDKHVMTLPTYVFGLYKSRPFVEIYLHTKNKEDFGQDDYYYVLDQKKKIYYPIPYRISYKESTDESVNTSVLSLFYLQMKLPVSWNPKIYPCPHHVDVFFVHIGKQRYMVHMKESWVCGITTSIPENEYKNIIKKVSFNLFLYDSTEKKETFKRFSKVKDDPYVIKPVYIGEKLFYEIYFWDNDHCYVVDKFWSAQFPEFDRVLVLLRQYSPQIWNIFTEYLSLIQTKKKEAFLSPQKFPSTTHALLFINMYVAMQKILQKSASILQTNIYTELRNDAEIYANDPVKKLKIEYLLRSYSHQWPKFSKQQLQEKYERESFLLLYLSRIYQMTGDVSDFQRFFDMHNDIKLAFVDNQNKQSSFWQWYASIDKTIKKEALSYTYMRIYAGL